MLKNKDRLTLSVKSKTWTRDSKRLFRLIPCYIWTWGSRWVIPRKDQPFADVPGLTMKFFHVWASYRATKTLKWIQTASAATLITNHWSPEIKEASLDHLELHSVSVKVILFSPNFGLVRLPELALSLRRRNVSHKFTDPSTVTQPPYWCASTVHQYGGQKIL